MREAYYSERGQNRGRKFVAALFLIAAVASLIPWTGGLAGFNKPGTTDFQFQAYTREQAIGMLKDALGETAVTETMTPDLYYRNLKLIRMFSDMGNTPYKGLGSDSAVGQVQRALGQFNRQKFEMLDPGERDKAYDTFGRNCKANAECAAVEAASKVTADWSVLGRYLVVRYPMAMLIALPFFLIMMPIRGVNILVELINPLRPLVALATFWGSWQFYPYVDTQARMTRAVHFAGLCLTFLLSSAGSIMAQTIKPGNKKKDAPTHLFQMDLRNSSFAGDGPPDPNIQVRASLYEPRFMIETVNTTSPRLGRFYSEVGGGWFAKKTAKTWLTLNAYSTQNQANERSLTAGGQFYRLGPRATWAFPVIRYEHSVTGPPAKTFAVVANPLFRFKAGSRFGIAPDVSLRKTLGKALVWNLGAGFKFFPGRGRRNSVEIGVFRNSLGQTSVRARSTLNFAF